MLDVIRIGPGPSGLACAIAAHDRSLSYLVLEKGSVSDAIRRFPLGMTFFSTSEMLEIGGVPFIRSGLSPDRMDAVRYDAHLARSLALKIETGQESRVDRRGGRPVCNHLLVRRPLVGVAVVVATGYFDTPHAFDVPKIELPKVRRLYDEPYACIGQYVTLAGGRNSVVDAALEKFRAGVAATIVHRVRSSAMASDPGGCRTSRTGSGPDRSRPCSVQQCWK